MLVWETDEWQKRIVIEQVAVDNRYSDSYEMLVSESMADLQLGICVKCTEGQSVEVQQGIRGTCEFCGAQSVVTVTEFAEMCVPNKE